MTPPLVLLHGVGLDRHIWRALRGAMPQHRTYAYDLRGHGGGPDWHGPACLEGFVDDLWDYADGQGLDRFALCGFSMGVLIAQAAALQQPSRLTHLVLLNGVYDRQSEQLEGIRSRLALAKENGPQAIIDAALTRWLPKKFAAEHPELQDQLRQRLESNDPDQFLNCYDFFAKSGTEITGRLGRINHPSLIATGGLDQGSTPEMSRRMAAEMPNARVVIFEDAAHMLPLQYPVDLAVLIDELLDE